MTIELEDMIYLYKSKTIIVFKQLNINCATVRKRQDNINLINVTIFSNMKSKQDQFLHVYGMFFTKYGKL